MYQHKVLLSLGISVVLNSVVLQDPLKSFIYINLDARFILLFYIYNIKLVLHYALYTLRLYSTSKNKFHRKTNLKTFKKFKLKINVNIFK